MTSTGNSTPRSPTRMAHSCTSTRTEKHFTCTLLTRSCDHFVWRMWDLLCSTLCSRIAFRLLYANGHILPVTCHAVETLCIGLLADDHLHNGGSDSHIIRTVRTYYLFSNLCFGFFVVTCSVQNTAFGRFGMENFRFFCCFSSVRPHERA